MIKTFRDKRTAQIFEGKRPRGVDAKLAKRARTKLITIDRATSLNELATIPGNRFEALGGNRLGQYSIRVNQQYRICFEWEDGAEEVEFVDYH